MGHHVAFEIAALMLTGFGLAACGEASPTDFYDPSNGAATGGSGGGTGGTASTSIHPNCDSVNQATGSNPVITDFESGDPRTSIETSDHFVGGIYAASSPDSNTTVDFAITPPGHDSDNASRLVLNNNAHSGGGFGFWINPCYDASVYRGLAFWAKGSGNPVDVTVATMWNHPQALQGGCAGDCVANKATITLSGDWQPHTISWAEFSPPADPTQLININFHLVRKQQDGTLEYLEFWLDDIGFQR